MFEFLHQYESLGFWILQAVAGIIFIVHGIPKIKNPSGIAQTLHAPTFVGVLHGLAEVLGGIALVIGYQVQLVALVFGLIMLGAIYFKIFKWKVPFMAYNNTGWELDLLLLAVFVMLVTR